MFEGYIPSARHAVFLGQEEARTLRSGAIDSGHLLLGVLGVLPLLLPLSPEDVRARLGVGDDDSEGFWPFTDAALRVLKGAPAEAERLGHGAVAPGHLLLALADRELPIGDLGHPRVDARVLLAMLGLQGAAAELLREHGLDEAAVRGALGGP